VLTITTPPAPIGTAEALSAPAVAARHGFFTRRGGVSLGPYASLNCGLSTGDARAAVLENRARAAQALGADPDCLVGLNQVHGTDAVEVAAPWRPGEGPRADAMVTRRKGIALGVITADCAPVLLADATAGVVGAAHAGWRGALAGVLEATLAAMARLGARAEHIEAAIGPCIGQASYEVGDDLRAAVLAHAEEDARFFAGGRRPRHWQFDLAGYCMARLRNAGIVKIGVVARDTVADESAFFSHRRRTLAGGGPIGHQISVVVC
jgi:YfiH family protein